MIKLDDNLLTELGLQSLPAEDKKALLRHIYETLEMRVGTTLARQMTDAQLDEFESFINSNDEAGALRWLETNFPNYKDVVAQEFEVLKAEVRRSAPQIMASAGSSATAMQQPQQMVPEVQPQMVAPAPQPAEPQYQQPIQQQAQPQQYATPQQSYEVQQPTYGAMPQQQPQMPQPMPGGAQQPMQADYQQYQAPQPVQQPQPQPIQQFDATGQQQQYPTPQYPQPVTPSPYQQPTQQVQQPQQPFDQNQFGQAA